MMPPAGHNLLPSSLIRKAAPQIEAILTSYTSIGAQSPSAQNDDAFSPYFRGISSTDTANHNSTRLISSQELSEWQTPHMPLLTARQLELTLLEIRRRQKHYLKSNASSTTTPSTSKREAAIFVPLCTVDGIPSVLFTRRSSRLSSHASQISFPGGYYDESLDTTTTSSSDSYFHFDILGKVDNKLANTAIREMQEELSFNLQLHRQSSPFVSILGQTQPVPSMNGNKVTPIIGQFNYDLPHFSSKEFKSMFPGNTDELDWIFTVSIKQLVEQETAEPLKKWGDQDMAKTKGRHEVWGPVFPVPEVEEKREGDKIWGLTASVLRPLLHRVLKPVFCEEVGRNADNASRL
jgi:nudix motif 8